MANTVKENRDEMRVYCDEQAKKFGVSSSVHPEDLIFQFCVNHECFDTVDKAIQYYFAQSCESANKLASLIKEHYSGDSTKVELLEFASGYGAVTRHIVNVLPSVNVTACDIHKEAVEFIRDTFNIQAAVSSSAPKSLDLPVKYDVIFALSFFSHMPKQTWGNWLLSLVNYIKDGGLMIFTTHGELSRKNFGNPRVDDDGFWFKEASEQTDLDVNEYGMTVTLKNYVEKQIAKIDGAQLILYQEAYWWEHQDVYVLEKAR